MYYATEVAATGEQCISVATSPAPAGPFIDNSSGPFICQSDLGGSIDPQPFVDSDGMSYLYWKSNAGRSAQPAVHLGRAASRRTGCRSRPSPHEVLAQDQPWESTSKAPTWSTPRAPMCCSIPPDSGTVQATAWVTPTAWARSGRCTKPQSSPVLHSDAARLGPGGESLFQDPSGNWWMAYHAWDGPASDYSYADGEFRSLWIAPVTFSGGTPDVASGEPPEGYHLFAKDGGVFTFGATRFAGSMGGTSLRAPVGGGASDPATGGYWEVGSDGGVFAFGAPFAGSMGGRALAAPIAGMVSTPDGVATGWWRRTVGSSRSAMRASTARWEADTSPRPSWPWRRRRTGAATG